MCIRDSLDTLETGDEELFEPDELFPDAVELVVRTGQASISLLQRRFRIGYTRAARLIDDLERRGIVGEYEAVSYTHLISKAPGQIKKCLSQGAFTRCFLAFAKANKAGKRYLLFS